MHRNQKNILCENPILCRIYIEFIDCNMEVFKQWLLMDPEVNDIYNKELEKIPDKIKKQYLQGGSCGRKKT